MATQENKIRFSIGSVFSGEGFTKADNAMKGIGRTAKSAMPVIGSVFSDATKMADGLGGAVGKVGSSVMGVASSFANMGIAGGVMAAMKVSADWLTESFKELADELDAIEKEWNDAVDAYNAEAMKEAIDATKYAMTQLKDVSQANQKAFDSMTAAAAKMADAVAKTADAKGASTISEMLIGNFNEAMKAETASLKALITAQGNEAVARVKEQQVREQQAAKIGAAQDAYTASLRAVVLSTDSVKAAAEAVREAEKEVAVARQKYGTTSSQYATALADREKATAALTATENDLTARQAASALAAQNLEVAQAQGAAAISAATLATQQAQAATEEAAKADRIAAMKQDAKNEAIAAATDAVIYYEQQVAVAKEGTARHAEMTRKLEDAESALMDARIAAATEEEAQRLSLEKLRKSNETLASKRKKAAELEGQLSALQDQRKQTVKGQERAMQTVEAVRAAQQAINAGLSAGMATDQQVHRGISGQGYTYQVGANGTPDNFIDYQRAQRYGGRAERDAASAAARNDSAARRYDRLLDDAIQDKKISDRDQKFMDDYESFMDSQRTESEWQQAIDDLKGAQNKTLSDLDKRIDDLKTKLEELGLK